MTKYSLQNSNMDSGRSTFGLGEELCDSGAETRNPWEEREGGGGGWDF